jgi:hypothetical protein
VRGLFLLDRAQNILIKTMPISLPPGTWPAPLAHCGNPLLDPLQDYVTIGEISSQPAGGYMGNRFSYTALVRPQDLSAVLNIEGGLHCDVQTGSPLPVEPPSVSWPPRFWIDMPTPDSRFESLVVKWESHNRFVLLPDNAFLMTYRLIPETAKDGSISWHDLEKPLYNVVNVTPVSRFEVMKGYTDARVTVLRDYLEDYLSRRECVAVVTYFDERYSTDDPQVENFMASGPGTSEKQPGRTLWFHRMNVDAGNQLSQVSATTTLMVPLEQPITAPHDVALSWPDHDGPILGKGNAQFGLMEVAYVTDDALLEYQDRPDFDINPESGFVGYGIQWHFSHCERYGRNHIEFELRKLYDGTGPDIIKHFHKYAVSAKAAELDLQTNGDRNVGIRTKEVIEAFLGFTQAIAELAIALNLALGQESISKLNAQDVKHNGWWTFADLKRIGRVIPLTMSFHDFLSRCKDLFEIIGGLKKSPLLQIVLELGLKMDQKAGQGKETLGKFESLRLAGTLCQLSWIAVDSGFSLLKDRAFVVEEWNSEAKLAEFAPLFALNGLRIASAHNVLDDKVETNLEVFGIDPAMCHNGWGHALDKVYDQTVASLRSATKLIRQSY